MLGNLIEMEYRMFPGKKEALGSAGAANHAAKKQRSPGADAVLKNVGGQELGGTGEEVERVDGGLCDTGQAQGRRDVNLAHFEHPGQTQTSSSRTFNRFLRLGQSGNQLVLQVKAPYVCLLQKVQVVVNPCPLSSPETPG